jgi:uncharacterized protein YcnI
MKSGRLRIAVGAIAVSIVAATTAVAHVEVEDAPGTGAARRGEILISVPNESNAANMVSVAVQLPENVVQASFPKVAGWTIGETRVPLDTPVRVGGIVTRTRVSQVTWSRGRLAPGRTVQFRLRLKVGEGTKRRGLAFPAVQRFADGEVVRWIGSPGSDAPAGVLETLLPAVAVTRAPPSTPAPAPAPVPGSPTTSTIPEPTRTRSAPAETDDGGGRGAMIGITAAVLAAAFGVGAIARSRRRR